MKKWLLFVGVGYACIINAMDIDLRQLSPGYACDLSFEVWLRRAVSLQLALSITQAYGGDVAQLHHLIAMVKDRAHMVSVVDWRAIDDWGNELTNRLRDYRRWQCLRDRRGLDHFVFPILYVHAGSIDMNTLCVLTEWEFGLPSLNGFLPWLVPNDVHIPVESNYVGAPPLL